MTHAPRATSEDLAESHAPAILDHFSGRYSDEFQEKFKADLMRDLKKMADSRRAGARFWR